MVSLDWPIAAGRVLTQADEMQSYLRDYTGRHVGAACGVALPDNTAEVAALLRRCFERGIAVVAQGGNTGLVGGATPNAQGQALVLSLSRMKRLRKLDPVGNTVTVEAGMVLQNLQQHAAEAGRLFPLSLAAQGSCTVGGNLATNAGGTAVLRYGSMRDLCLGLEVVTPSGEVLDGLRELRKDNTGYDLRHLFIGAEGTLGVITAATLKLLPQPKARVTAWVAVSSVAQALALLQQAQQCFGAELTAFELMSDYCVSLVAAKFADSPRVFAETHPWTVLLESSDPESATRAQARFLGLMGDAFDRGVVADAAIAQSEAQSQQFWKIRERIALAQPPNFKHDISLPIDRIAEFVADMEVRLGRSHPGCRTVVLGHLGDGNLHYNVEPPAGLDADAFASLEAEVHALVYGEVDRLRGSISAEHGIGAAKVADLRRFKSGVELSLMQAIKRAIDPRGIMNPGKLFALEP